MANTDIQGTITDSSGNPISGATVYLAAETNTNKIIATTTDSNGEYIFTSHPDGDGTSQEWHVAAYYEDGSGNLFNSVSQPKVSASLGSPSPIPDSGLVYYYNAAESSLSDGDSVPDIDDQSGNGNDASLDTGSATFKTNGVGSNPYYELTDDMYLTPSAHSTSLSGYSLYLVYVNNSHPPASGNDRSFEFSRPSTLWPWSDNTSFYLGIGDTSSRWIGGVSANDTSIANAVVGRGDGSQNKVEQHNANSEQTLGTQSQTDYTFSSQFHLGGTSQDIQSNLQFYELIFYNRDLSASERSDVETYLSDKYGLVF